MWSLSVFKSWSDAIPYYDIFPCFWLKWIVSNQNNRVNIILLLLFILVGFKSFILANGWLVLDSRDEANRSFIDRVESRIDLCPSEPATAAFRNAWVPTAVDVLVRAIVRCYSGPCVFLPYESVGLYSNYALLLQWYCKSVRWETRMISKRAFSVLCDFEPR